MTINLSRSSPSSLLAGQGLNWGWLLALGIAITALGVIGLGMTYWLTIVAVFWLGVILFVAGIGQLADAFHHSRWKGIAAHVIIGILYLLAAIILITRPVASAFTLTLFFAITLMVAGLMRSIMAFQLRGAGGGVWLLVLVSGLVSIAFGALVFGTIRPPGPEALATPDAQAAWLRSWGWVIGLFVAVELIMEGLAVISIALSARPAGASGSAHPAHP
jgi:uncharacterized membrane protein HdeD (DUF308 family)